MDRLGVALATVDGLRVFDFPPDSAEPPFAFVAMPESIDYDLTFGRGYDRFTLQVHVGVGTQVDRETRDALAGWASGAPGSVKAAIEGIDDFTAQVLRAEFGIIQLAGQAYPGVAFTIDIAA
jgi:hypothetical protein